MNLNQRFELLLSRFFESQVKRDGSALFSCKIDALGLNRTVTVGPGWSYAKNEFREVWKFYFKDRPVILTSTRAKGWKMLIECVKMIRSTSPRFKKFLSALISLDFRSNFTKCVIKLFNPKNFKKIFCEFSGRATGYILMQINIRYDFGVHSKMSFTWNGFFKCSKSTFKKYNFKKRNQWVF